MLPLPHWPGSHFAFAKLIIKAPPGSDSELEPGHGLGPEVQLRCQGPGRPGQAWEGRISGNHWRLHNSDEEFEKLGNQLLKGNVSNLGKNNKDAGELLGYEEVYWLPVKLALFQIFISGVWWLNKKCL